MSGTPQARVARGNALVLAAAQAVLGSPSPIAIALGALAGSYLLGADKSLATAPVTGFTLGVALGAAPAALLIRRFGARDGFLVGALITALGGALATVALFGASFALFAAGLLVIGIGGAFVQQFRFAAADSAPPAFKARAISLVLAGGVFTAIIGPQIVIFTREALAPVMFAGALASIVGLALVGGVILLFFRNVAVNASADPQAAAPARPLSVIVADPAFFVGLLCAVGSYALMSFVMTGAPLAMVGCGFTTDDAALGISFHVMAMFAPSFFTGRLIARFGAERIVAAGFALLVGCALVALSGIALWQFWAALVLLGLGWNFGFIGATAMVASSYRESEKGKVQGLHDSILFGSVAFGSLMSGAVYNAYGWAMLNWIVFPVTAACLLGLGWLRFADRRGVDDSAHAGIQPNKSI